MGMAADSRGMLVYPTHDECSYGQRLEGGLGDPLRIHRWNGAVFFDRGDPLRKMGVAGVIGNDRCLGERRTQ